MFLVIRDVLDNGYWFCWVPVPVSSLSESRRSFIRCDQIPVSIPVFSFPISKKVYLDTFSKYILLPHKGFLFLNVGRLRPLFKKKHLQIWSDFRSIKSLTQGYPSGYPAFHILCREIKMPDIRPANLPVQVDGLWTIVTVVTLQSDSPDVGAEYCVQQWLLV